MPKTSSPAGFMLLLAALLWIAGVVYFGFSNAPQLPLDSGNDAETQAALNAAQSAHWLKTALTALLPPAVLLVALKFLRRS